MVKQYDIVVYIICQKSPHKENSFFLKKYQYRKNGVIVIFAFITHPVYLARSMIMVLI